MAGKSQSSGAMVKSIAPFLSVRNGAKAVDFYKAAFGATESFRHDDPGSGSLRDTPDTPLGRCRNTDPAKHQPGSGASEKG